LIAWYETTMPNSISSTESADGVQVSTWYDISKSSTTPSNATQATPANQPIYTSNALNGLPVLKFNGAQYFLASNGQMMGKTTIFVVNKFDTGSALCAFIMGSQGVWQAGSLHLLLACTGSALYPQYSANSTSDFVNNNLSIVDGKFHIITYLDPNVGTKYIYIDGSNVETTATSVTDKSFVNYSIGAWYQSAVSISRYLSGSIAEIIIFNRDLNSQERQDVEQYLGQKWGITTP
jgi:hypothetical protein